MARRRRLAVAFFARSALDVAPELLNKLFVVNQCVGRIVEVEAYTRDDPASHSFNGETARNAVMFGPPGRLYVYFTYGMHHCANVVTGMPGSPGGSAGGGEAVLIRAVDPMECVDEMILRRRRTARLADGPGKLCQAFGVDIRHNGADLRRGPVGLFDDGVRPPDSPTITPRIGITKAVDWPRRWLL